MQRFRSTLGGRRPDGRRAKKVVAAIVVLGVLGTAAPAVANPFTAALSSIVTQTNAQAQTAVTKTQQAATSTQGNLQTGVTNTQTAVATVTPPVTSAVSSVGGLLGGIAQVTNVVGGLAQGQLALTQLLAGLQNAATVAGPVVTAHATEAAATAITNLSDRAAATVAAAAALDLDAAQSEITGIVTDLQAQALGEVAGLLPLALTTGLQVAQDIVTPLCGLLAVPSSLLPGVGLNTRNLWMDSNPEIQQIDQATNKLLRSSRPVATRTAW